VSRFSTRGSERTGLAMKHLPSPREAYELVRHDRSMVGLRLITGAALWGGPGSIVFDSVTSRETAARPWLMTFAFFGVFHCPAILGNASSPGGTLRGDLRFWLPFAAVSAVTPFFSAESRVFGIYGYPVFRFLGPWLSAVSAKVFGRFIERIGGRG
jgi:hypothetical protein